MTYTKPEIAVLGDACQVIKGSKIGPPEAVPPFRPLNHHSDTELDE